MIEGSTNRIPTGTRRGRAWRSTLLVLLAVVAVAGTVWSGGRGEPGPVRAYRVDLPEETADLEQLGKLDLDIDAVLDGWARVYLVPAELDKLRALGYRVEALSNEEVLGPRPAPGEASGPRSTTVSDVYHTYATLTTDLQAIAAQYPQITRLYSLGQSVQLRELWMMKITDNPDDAEDEPEFAYISSMHGDEVIGKEMCFNLIDYLTQNYGTDSRVTDLVDNTEIWIMPSMNPDGTELAQRYNANGFDLNRNFPDQFVDAVNTPDGRQPETQAVMNWAAGRTINLAANFHGGILVVNYPFDSNPAGTSTFSPAPDPDHDTFVSISRTYADNNPPMSVSNSHPAFDNGITNGADWYSVNGALQDWSYVWHGTMPVLIELDNLKWPPGSTLPDFWKDNQDSMLAYLERVHEGVRGTVTDAASGQPVAASIRVDSNPIAFFTDPAVGDYHRIVLPGSYSMELSAPGYAVQTIPVTVAAGPAARYDVALQPLAADLQPVSGRILDGAAGNGYLDPGETADLAVTLKNLGHDVTGVTAQLEATGWYASVMRVDASYPDLALGASQESVDPHFEVLLDGAVPTGHKVGFVVRWESEQGSGVSQPFYLEVGSPSSVTPAASDVPQAILDHTTLSSQIDSTTTLEISEVQVPVDLTHTYIGDLSLTLTSPSATAVVLHNRGGGSADNIIGTYGVDLTPAQSLDTWSGEPAGGTWQLDVADHFGGDTGTLNSWSLVLIGRPPEAATPEMRLRDLSHDADGVHLRWWPYPGVSSYRVYRAVSPVLAAGFVDVTADDPDDTDTHFLDLDATADALVYYHVTGVGAQGESPQGHFGQ